jgi:peroxiredoxin
MERNSTSTTFTIGSKCPEFKLKNVDGNIVGNEWFNGARAALVIFTCNHCPYVKGSEELLNKTLQQYFNRGLKVIAISANDPLQYPEDSFEKMKEKAAAMKLPYPYLFDETQKVAKSFDAACTPECYLFDSSMKLVFHGTINDSPRDSAKVTKEYLRTAIEQTLSGEGVDPSFVHPMGCSIKWK